MDLLPTASAYPATCQMAADRENMTPFIFFLFSFVFSWRRGFHQLTLVINMPSKTTKTSPPKRTRSKESKQ
jgi:hypothetical protein